MGLIRLFDKILWMYFKITLICKKTLEKLSIEIIIIILVFACYAPRDTQYFTFNPETYIMKKTNDSINYLLRMTEIRDSINIIQLRHRPSMLPILSKNIHAVTNVYGMHYNKTYGIKRFHDGIDLAAPKGTPVYATADGVIEIATYNDGYGNHVQIDHENGYKTFYGHLDKMNVIKGQKIVRGDTIGFVGSTGISTGFHLHYKITYREKPINPDIFTKILNFNP